MTNKHSKTSTVTQTFYGHVDADDLDTLANFDDRTLASLAGSSIRPLSDGVNNEDPTKALGLGRWQDRFR